MIIQTPEKALGLYFNIVPFTQAMCGPEYLKSNLFRDKATNTLRALHSMIPFDGKNADGPISLNSDENKPLASQFLEEITCVLFIQHSLSIVTHFSVCSVDRVSMTPPNAWAQLGNLVL